MISFFIGIMNSVRENILEAFIIPELGISYWDFCITMLIIGLVITVLVNSVKSEIKSASRSSKKNKSGKGKSGKGNSSGK